jgi:hypothetical protein
MYQTRYFYGYLEDYSVLQTAGKEVFQEINELINKGITNINGQGLTL